MDAMNRRDMLQLSAACGLSAAISEAGIAGQAIGAEAARCGEVERQSRRGRDYSTGARASAWGL